MKRTIVLVGLLVFLIVAYFTHSYLKESVEDQVTIEWANSLVWAAIGSQSSVKFVEPKVAADAQPEHWVVSGEIVLRQSPTETATHPYTARVARLCEAERRECWSLKQLVIGGSEVDLTGVETDTPGAASQTVASEPAPATQPVPAEGGGSGIATGPVDSAGAGASAAGAGTLRASDEPGKSGATPDPASEIATLSGEAAPEAAQETPRGTATSEQAASPATSDAEVVASQYTSERRQMIAEIQARLLDLGYDPGPVDGLMGPQTRTAIEDYQRQNDFTVNGEPSAQLLQLLEQQQ